MIRLLCPQEGWTRLSVNELKLTVNNLTIDPVQCLGRVFPPFGKESTTVFTMKRCEASPSLCI